jgi:putative Mg2+ transporter-C (MgtC) family protein
MWWWACHNPGMVPEWELYVRLVVAAGLGGAVGLERELRDQPAGFRTHMLVSLGSCLFALVSAFGVEALFGGETPTVSADPTRIAAQIVSGIGFLGAGAILRYGTTVRGLTTAASLWVVAAIGMAAAFGAYLLSVATAALTLVALFGLRPLRSRMVRGLKKEHEELIVDVGPELELEDLVRDVRKAGLRIDHLRVSEEEGSRTVRLFVAVPPGSRTEDAVDEVTRLPGVRNVDWNR